MGGPTIMRSFAWFEGDRAAMLHIRQDRDVTAFDREDAIRFRVPRDLADDTTWRLRHWAWTGLVQAKDRLIRIDWLVERVAASRSGYRGVAAQIFCDRLEVIRM
jgi:hypothetical protein